MIRTLVIAALIALALPALAFAQDGASPIAEHIAAPDATPPWELLAASALGIVTLLVRRYDLLRFLPDSIDDIGNVFLTSAIGTLVPLLQGGGFTWPGSLWTAIFAGMGGVMALLTPPAKRDGGESAPPALRLLLVSFFALSLASCACWRPTDPAYNGKGCVVARGLVDCTGDAFAAQKDRGLQIATGLISTGTFDVPSLLQGLTEAGIRFGECVLALLDQQFLAQPQRFAASRNIGTFHTRFAEWKAAERPGVRYALPSAE